MRRSKKTRKLYVTGLCEGNSPVNGEFPALRASNAENVSIWWRDNGYAHKQHPTRGTYPWNMPMDLWWFVFIVIVYLPMFSSVASLILETPGGGGSLKKKGGGGGGGGGGSF